MGAGYPQTLGHVDVPTLYVPEAIPTSEASCLSAQYVQITTALYLPHNEIKDDRTWNWKSMDSVL
jgi:hypothetical protein